MIDRAAIVQSLLNDIASRLKDMELHNRDSFLCKSDLSSELRGLYGYLERIRVRELKLQLEDYSMNIEFETFHTKHLTFDMVDPGALFVCIDGHLYQKSYDCEDDEKDMAWMICDKDGAPQGQCITFYSDEKIDRILPKIKRISF